MQPETTQSPAPLLVRDPLRDVRNTLETLRLDTVLLKPIRMVAARSKPEANRERRDQAIRRAAFELLVAEEIDAASVVFVGIDHGTDPPSQTMVTVNSGRFTVHVLASFCPWCGQRYMATDRASDATPVEVYATLTPFGALLASRSQWLAVDRPTTRTTLLLHRDLGAWVEADTESLRALSHEDAFVFVEAMDAITEPGQHLVEVKKARGRLSARAVRVAPPPAPPRAMACGTCRYAGEGPACQKPSPPEHVRQWFAAQQADPSVDYCPGWDPRAPGVPEARGPER